MYGREKHSGLENVNPSEILGCSGLVYFNMYQTAPAPRGSSAIAATSSDGNGRVSRRFLMRASAILRSVYNSPLATHSWERGAPAFGKCEPIINFRMLWVSFSRVYQTASTSVSASAARGIIAVATTTSGHIATEMGACRSAS